MDETPDRWTCRWCETYRHPVVTMVATHEARCAARPNEVDE